MIELTLSIAFGVFLGQTILWEIWWWVKEKLGYGFDYDRRG